MGEGSFASVYRAVNLTTKEIVAIKQIDVNELEAEAAFEEVDKLRKFKNDHIVDYHTSFYSKSEKTLSVVMELCKGNLRYKIN